ncbi:thrombopoietin isoform X2 [Echeneis naucrates]|uniref:Uncharacterized LOC115052913 n=1 Tax=Echeneis naucrates TaxID=173247 RepID=A0A665V106_ECHNA|nr:uncharacterized protein LOC115052913 isoform X2 [Echeneis naucrates]
MACSRLMLLLIGVISSHLPEVHSRPVDFWCRTQARGNMQQMIEDLRKAAARCDSLPSPVQLPSVKMNVALWGRKTTQHKRAELVGTIRAFQDGVQEARVNVTSQCQTSVLEKLEHRIRNDLLILNSSHIQTDTVTSPPARADFSSQTNKLSEVLKQYELLLKGKLNHFAIDVHDIICREDRTTNVTER